MEARDPGTRAFRWTDFRRGTRSIAPGVKILFHLTPKEKT